MAMFGFWKLTVNTARSYEDLSPRFFLQQSIGIFLGPETIKSPTVRSAQEVAKLRNLMAPFRELVLKPGAKKGAIFVRYSPGDLDDVWIRLQAVVKEMWENTGKGRSAAPLRRMRALYTSHAPVRSRHLQHWERQRMAMQDQKFHVRRLLLQWRNALARNAFAKQQVLSRKRMREEQQAERLRSERGERTWWYKRTIGVTPKWITVMKKRSRRLTVIPCCIYGTCFCRFCLW